MNFLDKGQCVKEYVVESIISSNGFYESYKVVDENNTPYFLKIYDMDNTPNELLYDNRDVLEFLNCMDLTHRNILEFIEHGEVSTVDKKYHYMITKFYKGETLEDYIKNNGKMSAVESFIIMKCILDGVSYMHDNGILHNKINPSNIIIDDTLNPAIIDLGNSRRNNDNNCTFQVKEKDLFYASVEAIKGAHSMQTDIFSLTALFFYMIIGKAPWEDGIIANKETIEDVRKIPLDFCGTQIDTNIKEIFIKGLSQECSKRYQNIKEIIKDLNKIDEIDKLVSRKTHQLETTEKKKQQEEKTSIVKAKKPKGNGFEDIAGMNSLKETLRKKVLFWLKNKEQAHKYKISLPNGMLLYGPPGCGKTFFAEKFAEEAGFNFIMVKASDIASTYVHGTQEKIAALFDSAQKMQPTILCFDEFDAVVPERTDMMQQTSGEVNEFLSQMNNCGHRGIFVIATSNRPDKIDPAILRTGRIDKLIYIPMPDEEARFEMFKLHLKDRPMSDIDLRRFAKETEGYIASDIAYIVNDAAMNAGIQDIPINESLMEASLQQTPPSVRPDIVEQYERVHNVLQGTGVNRRIPRIGYTSERYK